MAVKHKPRETRRPGRTDETEKRKAVEESAYFRWLNRGASHGADLEDWLSAEQEVLKNVYERDRES
jgi:hypothetical protein